MDSRVSKTRHALAEAATLLMKQFPWRDVSISMLCEKAEVSRTTFYKYFATKEDLLEQMFREIELQLTSLPSEERGLDHNGRFQFLPGLVQVLRKQKKAFQRQQNNSHGIVIANRTRLMIENMMKIEVQRSALEDIFDDRCATFLSGAISSLIRKWADENHMESDEEIVDLMDNYVSLFIISLKKNTE